MATYRQRALDGAAMHKTGRYYTEDGPVSGYFGRNVLDLDKMAQYMSSKAYESVLASVKFGAKLDLSVADEIAAGIEKADTIGGRSHIIRDEKLTVIDDCYNANPVSMKAAIELLDTAQTKKVAILGDMFELGEDEKKLHHEVGSFITHKNIDVVICIGDLAEEIYLAAKEGNAKCYHFKTKAEMMSQASQLISEKDTILIKASHGMGFNELVTFCSSHMFL